MVHETFGQKAGFRFWGFLLLASSVVFAFIERIPVHIGNNEVASLQGWRKAIAVGPMFAVGLAIIIWPTVIACSINLRGYSCP